MRKYFRVLSVLMVLVGLLAPATAMAKVEISLLTRMAGTTPQVQIFQDIIAEFKAKYPDVEIIDYSQGDESAFNNILRTSIATGAIPSIFRVQGVANLGEYIANGILMNVDPILEANPEWSAGFAEGALNYYRVPGFEGTYAIPMESGLIGIFYNEALFKKAGINKFPETWTEFKAAINKLNAIGVTPIALGARSSYMVGHLHNNIFYKWLGVDAAKALGSRDMKWTDPAVVETIAFVKELVDMGAFHPAALGLTDDVVLNDFLYGDAAMIITGPWNIPNFTDPSKTEFVNDIKLAKFPYFEEKPEFKDHDMQVISPYMISGKLEGKELEYTIELVKMLTSAEAAKRYAEEASFIIPRDDVQLNDNKVNRVFKACVELSGTSQGIAVDVFDYDPFTAMQDVTRNALQGIFMGDTPEQAAANIQDYIEWQMANN